MTTTDPPRLTRWLFRRALPPGMVGRSIEGDLREEFAARVRAGGRRTAAQWYRREVIAIGLRYLFVPRRSTRRRKPRPRGGMMDAIWQDLRFALRSLRASPMFAVTAAGTLALGIGAVTVVFSIADGVLLKPLPYPAPDRIVSVSEDNPGIDMPIGWTSVQNFLDWKEQCQSFESLALFRGRSMSFTGNGRPEYAYGAFVTAEFFSIFGVTPRMGRTLDPEENLPGADQVVILAQGAWQRRFASDPAILGQTIEVDGRPHRVIGVMPRGFDAPARWISPEVTMELWVPMVVDPASPQAGRDNRSYNAVGRLRVGVTLEQARADLTNVHDRLREAFPLENGEWHAQLFGWQDLIVRSVRPALLMLLGAVALLLLIACANVANLKLHRMLSREGELALRAALGAGRGRLVRQSLTESLLIASMGGVLGAALAVAGVKLLSALNPGNIPRWDQVTVDVRALGVALVATGATAVAFGVVPALRRSRGQLFARLREVVSLSETRGRHRARATIVVAQLALSVALLVGTTLLAKSFARLLAVPPGLNPDGVLTATVVLSWNRVDELSARAEFVRRTLDELRSLPGVETAGMINSLPFSGSNSVMPFVVEGREQPRDTPAAAAAFRGISPGYLETMEIPLLGGRDLLERDLARPNQVLVNERMAKLTFPGTEAVGQRLAVWYPDAALEEGDWMTVVGVVGDVRHYGLDRDILPEIYIPYSAERLSSKSFVLKTSGDPDQLAPMVRERLAAVDPLQPLRDIRPMTAYLSRSVANPRFNTAMLTLASIIALILSGVGLFGVVACAARERSREIGIRMALGAERRSVLALVLRRGLVLGGVGLVLGVTLSLALVGTLEHLLFGIRPTDVTTFLGVAVTFMLLSLAASLAPALGASRIDPMRVLRAD